MPNNSLSPRKSLTPAFLCVYMGYLPQIPHYEYLIILSTMRKIDKYNPVKAFPEATHQIQLSYKWKDKEGKLIQTILHSEQFDAGHWKIKEFQTEKDKWRGETEYFKKLKEIDGCAKTVTRFFISQVIYASPNDLIMREGVSYRWRNVIAGGLEECRNLYEQTKKLYKQGNRVWYE